jgi:hypothetical protein
MEYQVRSPRDTLRNMKRARYHLQYEWALDVVEELRRRGVTDYPARLKGMSENEYKAGLIDVLIDDDMGRS